MRSVRRVQMKAPQPFHFPKDATATGFRGGGVAGGNRYGFGGTGISPEPDILPGNYGRGTGYDPISRYTGGGPTVEVNPSSGSSPSYGSYGPEGYGYAGMPWMGPTGVLTTIGNSGLPRAVAVGGGSPALDAYNGMESLAGANYGIPGGASKYTRASFARGGIVPGMRMRGQPHDTVPAMLDPGEVILNEKEQGNVKPTGRLPGEIAAQLYAARKAKHFKEGGVSGDHWIRGAVKHPGAFTASAKRAGKSVHEYAVAKQHAGGTLGRRARLALTFEGMRR